MSEETIVRLNGKTALANDGDLMADIFDEFNELKANKKPQKPNSIYYGYGSSYKIIDVLNDKDGDFINCRLFIVKELGVDECLGFYAPPMIDIITPLLLICLKMASLQYIMKPILQISGVFWIEDLTTLSG
ncbi:hypothetical protein BTM277_05360 [Helicobacter pylori]